MKRVFAVASFVYTRPLHTIAGIAVAGVVVYRVLELFRGEPIDWPSHAPLALVVALVGWEILEFRRRRD